MPPCPPRQLSRRMVPALAITAFIAACETVPAPVEAPGTEAVVEAQDPVMASEPETEILPGPSAPGPRPKPVVVREDYIGKPPSALEALTGPADFVRAEGKGEFRRYDEGDCRIYAVVTAEDGGRALIRTLNVSSMAGGPAPRNVSECIQPR